MVPLCGPAHLCCASAQGANQTSRREALASLSATVALLAASPAYALFGGPSKEDTYKEETVCYSAVICVCNICFPDGH